MDTNPCLFFFFFFVAGIPFFYCNLLLAFILSCPLWFKVHLSSSLTRQHEASISKLKSYLLEKCQLWRSLLFPLNGIFQSPVYAAPHWVKGLRSSFSCSSAVCDPSGSSGSSQRLHNRVNTKCHSLRVKIAQRRFMKNSVEKNICMNISVAVLPAECPSSFPTLLGEQLALLWLE